MLDTYLQEYNTFAFLENRKPYVTTITFKNGRKMVITGQKITLKYCKALKLLARENKE